MKFICWYLLYHYFVLMWNESSQQNMFHQKPNLKFWKKNHYMIFHRLDAPGWYLNWGPSLLGWSIQRGSNGAAASWRWHVCSRKGCLCKLAVVISTYGSAIITDKAATSIPDMGNQGGRSQSDESSVKCGKLHSSMPRWNFEIQFQASSPFITVLPCMDRFYIVVNYHKCLLIW